MTSYIRKWLYKESKMIIRPINKFQLLDNLAKIVMKTELGEKKKKKEERIDNEKIGTKR